MGNIFVIFLLAIANGVFAMSEISIVSARRARLQQRAAQGHRGARVAMELADAPNQFLSTVQIGITLIGVLAGTFGGATIAGRLAAAMKRVPVLAPYSEAASVTVVVLGISYLSLVIGELVPKRVGLDYAERIAAAVAPWMRRLSRIASPVVSLLSASTELILRILGLGTPPEEPVSEEEVKLMIEQATQEGVFELAEQDILERVFRLADRTVNALITPRPDVIWLDPDDPAEIVEQKILTSEYDHFVAARSDPDHVLGFVYAKDLLIQALHGLPSDLLAVIRPPLYLPETMSALKALESFRESQSQLALVIDEHGGLQGVVSRNDILEAIVGEIPLPDEVEEPEVVQRADGSWLLDGMLLVDELVDLLEIQALPYQAQGYYQTLGGMIMTMLGRIPRTGDVVNWGRLRFEVVDMDGRRVDKILVSFTSPEPDAPA